MIADTNGRQKRLFAATRSRFYAKLRPPRVFWAHFGSIKRYGRSCARDFKMAFGPPTRLTIHLGVVHSGAAIARVLIVIQKSTYNFKIVLHCFLNIHRSARLNNGELC
jgi:hypothetical protein